MATGLQSPARAGPNVSKSLKNEETETVYEFPPQSELLVLWAIRNGSSPGVYGLDIQRAIEESSSGNVNISVGTLYSMLKRLRKKGYVTSVEGNAPAGGGKRQYYSLTDAGSELVDFVDRFIHRLQCWHP